MNDIERLLKKVEQASIVQLLQSVLRIESTNPPGNELDLARWLADYFAQAGLHAEIVTYEGNRANLIARLKGARKRPALIFSAHMDTVPAGEVPWRFPPFSGTLHDGKVYGRGAADMKGGLAALAEAAVILARSGVSLDGDLIIAFSYDETHGLQGAKRMLEGDYLKGAGALLVAEPSTLDVLIAEKGALWLRCQAKGKTAHTSMPHLGQNAILEMVHFLHRLEESLDLAVEAHPLLGKPTFTVGTIQGGVTVNVIPDTCEAQLDIRLLPGMDHQTVVEQVRELGKNRVEVTVIDWKAPVETRSDSEITRVSLQAVEEITGVPREPTGVSYFTDGSVIANALDIPMVIIGPADTGMTHQPNEYVEVSRLVEAVKIYLTIAVRYLNP